MNRITKSARGLIFATLAVVSNTLVAAELNAQLDWSRRVELSVLVSGSINEIAVKAGTEVSKGQVLLRLDQRVYKERVNQAKARLESAQLEHDEAQKEMTRAQDLFDRTVLSIHELEVAKIGAAKANALLQEAKASFAHAETDLNYSEIRAPFDGRVVAISAEIGQSIQRDVSIPTLIVLVDDGKMLAKANVDESRINDASIGRRVRVLVGSREFRGDILSFSHEPISKADGKIQYEVIVVFEAKTMKLRAGQSAKIDLP